MLDPSGAPIPSGAPDTSAKWVNPDHMFQNFVYAKLDPILGEIIAVLNSTNDHEGEFAMVHEIPPSKDESEMQRIRAENPGKNGPLPNNWENEDPRNLPEGL